MICGCQDGAPLNLIMLPRPKLVLNCILKSGLEFKTKVLSDQSSGNNARTRILDVDPNSKLYFVTRNSFGSNTSKYKIDKMYILLKRLQKK